MSDSSNPLEWVEYAEGDFQYALLGLSLFPRGATYMFSQACEKYLKAVILAEGGIPPRTHDIDRLILLVGSPPSLDSLEYRAAQLLSQAVSPNRYPGDVDQPTPEEAKALEKAARVLRDFSRGQLSLEP